MASSVLTSLSLVLLVAGVTLGLASWALTARARVFRQRMQALLALFGQVHDPLEWPQCAWPVLRASGWHSLHCEGTWFGQPWSHGQGLAGSDLPAPGDRRQTHFVSQLLQREDIALELRLSAPRLRGEALLVAQQMARVFSILLESLVREKTEALAAALAQRAQLSLYLQHDMRNLCQWVEWVGADFEAAQEPDVLLQCAQRLQRNAPLARERAQRLQHALHSPSQEEPPREMDLGAAWHQAAQLAGVGLHVRGDASVFMRRQDLARVLDNLLTNAAQSWRQGASAPLEVHIERQGDAGGAQALLRCPLAAESVPTIAADRLFEPFSSGRPGGLGLGLYQARTSLRSAGGDIQAQVEPLALVFVLNFPVAEESQRCTGKVDQGVNH